MTPERQPIQTPEVPPEAPEIIAAGFEHVLEGSRFIGRGENAVVFQLSTEDAAPEEMEALFEAGALPKDVPPETLAAKILKVYVPGMGEREFELQRQARDILARSGGEGKELCAVPEAFMAHDQPLNAPARDLLNRYGARLENTAEVLIMDYVDGKDLGSLMYEVALARNGFEQETIDAMTYEQKEQEAGSIVGFEVLSGRDANPQEVESERSIVYARNEARLITYLRTSGFVLEPRILNTLERSIRTLHEQNFYHNDLHKQNVMVGNDGRVYLIDFGRATNHQTESGLDDFAGITAWRSLSRTPDEERAGEQMQFKASLEKEVRQMQKLGRYAEKIDALHAQVIAQGTGALEHELVRARGTELQLEQFLVMLQPLLTDTATSTSARTFLNTLMAADRKWRPAERTMVKRFVESGFLGV